MTKLELVTILGEELATECIMEANRIRADIWGEIHRKSYNYPPSITQVPEAPVDMIICVALKKVMEKKNEKAD